MQEVFSRALQAGYYGQSFSTERDCIADGISLYHLLWDSTLRGRLLPVLLRITGLCEGCSWVSLNFTYTQVVHACS
jgi:hypothetical protein